MKKLLLPLFLLCVFTGTANAQCFVTSSFVPSTCDTFCNGVVFLQFSTPNFPVYVSVNGGSPVTATSAVTFGNLCPGAYSFIAVDNNGDTCTGNTNILIPQLPGPTVTLTTVNATCSVCNDGAISAQISGGSAPYTYLWSIGTTTSNLINLSPGFYCLTVTDANGCSVTTCDTVGIGGNGFYALHGEIYLDLNSNGVKDVGEVPLGNQSVGVQPGGLTSISNSNGEHLSIVTPGTYDVSYVTTPGWYLTSTPATYNVNVTTNSITGLDFGIYPDSSAAIATITFSSMFPRCFWDVGYMAHVNNTGYTTLSGTVEITYDPALTFVNSTPVPITHIGNVLTYNYTNLPPGSVGNFNMTFTEPAGGTSISSSASMTGSDSFGNNITHSTVLNQFVSCSFDPNDKQVHPLGIGALNYVAMDEWLTYQIRFQNTGTDTAFKVVVRDIIDTNLDLNSLYVIGSSHNMTTSIHPSREVSFTFENILLPDSNVNEPASHGYILYRIKGLQSNPDPSTVENTAAIYFDLNAPVITNTTLTTFSDNFLGIAENNSSDVFEVFPNPMSHSATVRMKNNNHQEYSITVYDLAGRSVITSGKLENGSYTLYKGDLNAGVYILEASSVKGNTERLKLVVK